MTLDLGKEMTDAVNEAMRLLASRREEYVRAWIAETGLHPTECRLVETYGHTSDGMVITVRVERKERR